MKFIHVSDVHIGKAFSSSHFGAEFARMRREELSRTFERFIDAVNESGADYVFVSGDMVHRDDVTVQELKNANALISRSKVPFIAVSGNHDPTGEGSVYSKIDWCGNITFAPPGFGVMNLDGFDLYTYSWTTRYLDRDLLNEIEIADRSRPCILLAHGDLLTKSNFMPVDKAALQGKGFDYCALGHVHKHQFLYPNMAYAGSLEPLAANEQGEHGYILGTLDCITRELKTEFVPFSRRRYEDMVFQVEREDSDVSVTQRLCQHLAKLPEEVIYTVQLTGYRQGGTEFDCDAVERGLQQQGRYAYVKDATAPDYDLDALKREHQNDLVGQYIARFGEFDRLDQKERKALYYGLDALLQGRNGQ